MAKKSDVRRAAGRGASRGNVKERLTAAKAHVKPCTLCAALKSCPDNRKDCPRLLRCGVNAFKFV